jgi:hypothetical protein
VSSPKLETAVLNGETVVLGQNNALRLILQKHLAQAYPRCYPQFWGLLERLRAILQR